MKKFTPFFLLTLSLSVPLGVIHADSSSGDSLYAHPAVTTAAAGTTTHVQLHSAEDLYADVRPNTGESTATTTTGGTTTTHVQLHSAEDLYADVRPNTTESTTTTAKKPARDVELLNSRITNLSNGVASASDDSTVISDDTASGAYTQAEHEYNNAVAKLKTSFAANYGKGMSDEEFATLDSRVSDLDKAKVSLQALHGKGVDGGVMGKIKNFFNDIYLSLTGKKTLTESEKIAEAKSIKNAIKGEGAATQAENSTQGLAGGAETKGPTEVQTSGQNTTDTIASDISQNAAIQGTQQTTTTDDPPPVEDPISEPTGE